MDPGTGPPINLPTADTVRDDWTPDPAGREAGPLLDPQESSYTDPHTIPAGTQTEADETLQRSWRHSHWADRRTRTYHAMQAAGIGANRLARFGECGSATFVLRHKTEADRYCMACNRCHDRFCEACQRERRRALAGKLTRTLPPGKLRFITLTLKSNADPLARRLQGLYGYWKRLRTQLAQRNLLSGGVAFLEINRNETTNQWHPHMHIVSQGRFLPQKLLRDLWFKITGDSYIVDVREIKNPEIAAQYVMKYAGKGIGKSVWSHQPALVEAMEALSGKRTFNTFGEWHGLGLLKHETSTDDWEYLCTLAELVERHRSGDAEAGRILTQLANGRPVEPLDIADVDSRAPPKEA